MLRNVRDYHDEASQIDLPWIFVFAAGPYWYMGQIIAITPSTADSSGYMYKVRALTHWTT